MEGTSPEQMVFQALMAACSQDTEILKQAEQKLAEWEIQPGFYYTLVSIFSNHQVDVNVRWMAAVYLKNGINKYWRKYAKNEIQAEEKSKIRSQLISNFNEPVAQVAVQIAALTAKIARLDCPKEWPEIIPVLLEAVRSNDSLQQHRSLLVLQHVIKALSSKRLMPEKKYFEQLTSEVYSYILNLWDTYTTLFFQSLQENGPSQITVSLLEKAILALRILRKLTIYGIYKPHKSEHCMMFLEATFRRIGESIECRYELKRRSSADELVELIEKFILKQTKILNEFLEQHPVSFVNVISTALNFSFNYVFHNGASMIFDGNVINFPNFAIHCVNLMKGILSSRAYTTFVQENCSTEVDIAVALETKKDFFTNERLSYICEKIITHYFLLTQQDLDMWIEDPEGFAADDGGESWKYALRPCTETFFLTLFSHFRTEVRCEVLKYINKAQENPLTATSDLKDVILKDAIYNAAGLAPFILFDEIDFDLWFSNQLLAEVKITTDTCRIIRRRIIWLIGQWSGVKLSRELRPQVYELCLHLLQQNEDMSVRLASSKTLMMTIDDFDFSSESFLPYLEPGFSALFSLLKEAKECDTKMNVLCTMSFIVDKMGDNIQSHADNLISYLPYLWKESEDHNMLRCAIISTLLQIVKALYDIPPILSPFLYPVISISTNIKEPSHIYLMEEGLELWLAVVENTSQISQELLQLCENLLPIIENSSENLRTVLHLIQAYILLSPEVYLQRFGKQVVSTCAYLLNDMRTEGIAMVMKLYETMLRVEPTMGLELLRPALPHIFKQVYENKDYPLVMSMYLAILARVLIIDQQVFIEALQSINLEKPLEKVIDAWISKMPLVTQTEKRKLLSLALGSLITVDNQIFYERFPGILQNICESLNDIMKEDYTTGETDNKVVDSLVFFDEEDFNSIMCPVEEFDYNTYHSERCRKICLKDPVYRIILKDYIQNQLGTLKTNLGEQRYQTLMLTVDPCILANLTEYLNIYIAVPKQIDEAEDD
ncbi:importin-11 [Condylostylus longicornis]|uniref:importin-11 n=1 Tax=Condylostylus longicornis TaxID=2530218 RepID=UPI00244DA24B|nr:importin-11 [Condylostylus longicornis]